MTTTLSISYDDVARAHERLAGIAERTPVMRSATADALTGATLHFKCENLQRTGAFKIRGAYNAVAQFTPAQRAGGVITFSSGNHGQAIARAAQRLGVPALVVMPQDAPAMKVAATAGYGAEVVRYDRYAEDPAVIIERLAGERGMTFIPPFDHPQVMAGQGTAAKELFEEVGALDMIVTPLGGGGLLSGTAVAIRALRPGVQVIGVEPLGADDAWRSLRAGRIEPVPEPDTVADGLRATIGNLTFEVIREQVDEVVRVDDPAIIAAMRFVWERMKIVIEPSAAVTVAALLERLVKVSGRRVGVILTGGNLDLDRLPWSKA